MMPRSLQLFESHMATLCHMCAGDTDSGQCRTYHLVELNSIKTNHRHISRNGDGSSPGGPERAQSSHVINGDHGGWTIAKLQKRSHLTIAAVHTVVACANVSRTFRDQVFPECRPKSFKPDTGDKKTLGTGDERDASVSELLQAPYRLYHSLFVHQAYIAE